MTEIRPQFSVRVNEATQELEVWTASQHGAHILVRRRWPPHQDPIRQQKDCRDWLSEQMK